MWILCLLGIPVLLFLGFLLLMVLVPPGAPAAYCREGHAGDAPDPCLGA